MIKLRSPVTFTCLYSAASFSHFAFYLSNIVDVAFQSVELGVINIVSSTLHMFDVLQTSKSSSWSPLQSSSWWVTHVIFWLSTNIVFFPVFYTWCNKNKQKKFKELLSDKLGVQITTWGAFHQSHHFKKMMMHFFLYLFL